MMKKSIMFLSLILLVNLVNAQENTTKQPCMKVSSFSSSLGFGGALTSNTNDDYYTLKNTVENPGIFIDITNYKVGDPDFGYNMLFHNNNGFSYHSAGSGNGNLLFNLGLTPYSNKLGKYRENREIRISLGGSLGTRNNFYYYQNNSYVIDTYQSDNGDIVYADSVINKYYSYTLDFSEINIGFSYLFKTDVNRLVHFYTGIGMNYGLTLRSSVKAYEDIYRSVIYYNEYNKPTEEELNYYYNEDNWNHTYSTYTSNQENPIQFARVYIPLGLEIKLSKKPASFFNHADLYTELNPGVEFQVLTGEKTYANPYFGFAFIGFRYHW